MQIKLELKLKILNVPEHEAFRREVLEYCSQMEEKK